MKYLVDTEWIIDGLAEIPAALGLLYRLSNDGLAVSVVSLCEVLEGAYLAADPERQIRAYRQFLAGYVVLPVTDAIATRFAPIRATLRQKGTMIPDLDLLIAATAIEHDLTLLTRNARHFYRIPGLRLHRPA